jgi:integrase
LKEWSHEAIPTLVKANIIDAHQANNASEEDKLIATKCFLETEIKYYTILADRAEGNFLNEQIVFANPIAHDTENQYENLEREQFLQELLYPSEDTLEQFIRLLNGNNPPTEIPRISQTDLTPIETAKNLLSNNIPQPESILYSEAINKFVENKVNENRWKQHQIRSHRADLELFIRIMGDKPINNIDRNVIREYRDILSKLPPNFTKYEEFKNKPIDEILQINHIKHLSASRINFIVQAVGSMLDWYQAEGLIQLNPVKKLQIKDDRQSIELRNPIEIKDLEPIFSHKKYLNNEFKYPAYFWIPLIGLFTGMRLEEISQLHTKDIYNKDNIWIIDINDIGIDKNGFPKTLKNKNASRLVTLHHTLIDLGFIDFIQNISSQNNILIFNELKKTAKTGKYGKQPGKQFSSLIHDALNKDGFTTEKKSFHSLRHTFADFYKQRGWQDDVFRQLYGHEIKELASNTYGSKFPPEKIHEVIEKLDYGVDFSHLKNSKYIYSDITNK